MAGHRRWPASAWRLCALVSVLPLSLSFSPAGNPAVGGLFLGGNSLGACRGTASTRPRLGGGGGGGGRGGGMWAWDAAHALCHGNTVAGTPSTFPGAAEIRRGRMHQRQQQQQKLSMQEQAGGEVQQRRRVLPMGAMQKLPRVYPGHELLSRAIKRASRVPEDTTIRNSRARGRKFAAEKITTMSKELTKPLGEVLDGFRSVMRKLCPFEKVVVDLTVRSRELAGYGSLEETILAVKELRKTTTSISKAAAQAAANAETRKQAEEECNIALEEMQNLWEQDAWVLELLLDMSKELKCTPVLSEDLTTVVLVGSPNVGKSSIVRAISTGQPAVSNYPFTTRGMTIGHVVDDFSGEKIAQVMDTPGLLPRADEDRNEMELLTLASMQHIDSVVMFVMDLTGGSGEKSSIKAQLDVRDELKQRFPDHLWIDVMSKGDLPRADMSDELLARIPAEALQISTMTSDGVPMLEESVMELIREAHAKIVAKENEVSRWID